MIIGLGNPGSQYEGTRHNVGFEVVDELAARNSASLSLEKWQADYVKTTLWGVKVCLLKPMTYMNLSGKAAARFKEFFKIPLERILVVHDDIDMKLGRIKLTRGGGAGGHNGIRSLIECLGGKEFYRLKVGVGRPGRDGVHKDIPVDKYVLSSFSPDEQQIVAARMEKLEEGVKLFLGGESARATCLLNSLK